MIRKYCLRRNPTSNINNTIKKYIYNYYQNKFYYINPQRITNILPNNYSYFEANIKYCLECNKFFISQDNHEHKNVICVKEYRKLSKFHNKKNYLFDKTKFENINTQIEKSKIIGFWKKCKKLNCKKCLEQIHEKNSKYNEELIITDALKKIIGINYIIPF